MGNLAFGSVPGPSYRARAELPGENFVQSHPSCLNGDDNLVSCARPVVLSALVGRVEAPGTSGGASEAAKKRAWMKKFRHKPDTKVDPKSVEYAEHQ